jgi:hypothetical protein
MLPGETVIATIEPPQTGLSQTCAGMKALAGLCLDFWVFMRLWGLLHIYKWARETYVSQPKDVVLRMLVWTQIGASTMHVVLEGLKLLRARQIENKMALEVQMKNPQDAPSDQGRKKWRDEFYANAGWFPLTLHWSFEDETSSPVSEAWQGICGFVPAYLGMREAWAQTA